MLLLFFGLLSLLAVVKAAIAGVVSSSALVAATVGGTREGSAGADSVGSGTASVASAKTGDCAELGISVTVNNLATSVLDAALRCVVELVEVTVATSDAAGHLDISGIVGIVGNITLVIDELSALVVVVSSVIPGTEVVGPTAIAVISPVGVTIGVGAGTISERVSTHAVGVADVTGGVLVTLVAEASLLLSEVVIVVARDGVEGDVDLAGVVSPFVINRFLGVKVIVGAPLVPCVVNPLVVALAGVTNLTVGVVVVSNVPLLLALAATESSSSTAKSASSAASKAESSLVNSATEARSSSSSGTSSTEASSKTTSVTEATSREAATETATIAATIGAASIAAIAALSGGFLGNTVVGSLMTVVLVIRSITLRLNSVVVGSLPSLSGNDSTSEKNSLEHFEVKFSRL